MPDCWALGAYYSVRILGTRRPNTSANSKDRDFKNKLARKKDGFDLTVEEHVGTSMSPVLFRRRKRKMESP